MEAEIILQRELLVMGSFFDDVSASGFTTICFPIIAYMNTVVFHIFKYIQYGLQTEIGHIQKVPYIECNKGEISNLTQQNINISKENWDSFEIS